MLKAGGKRVGLYKTRSSENFQTTFLTASSQTKPTLLELSQASFHCINGRLKLKIQVSDDFKKATKSTGIGYIKEAVSKYSPGVVIPNVPSTPAPLRGRKLEGKLILKVPAQVNPIPQSVLRAAREENVIIRDTTGRIYK